MFKTTYRLPVLLIILLGSNLLSHAQDDTALDQPDPASLGDTADQSNSLIDAELSQLRQQNELLSDLLSQAQGSMRSALASRENSNSDSDELVNPELDLLRQQNEQLNSFQDSILTTVYWAFGLVFAIALGLATFSWFSSFKLYERDKVQLKEDVDEKLTKFELNQKGVVAASQAEVQNEITEFELKQAAINAASQTEAYKEVDRKIADSLSGITENLASLSTAVEGVKKSAFENKSMSFRNMMELRSVEEFVWEARDVPYNVLLTQAQAIEAAAAANNKERVLVTIERMKKIMNEKFLTLGEAISERGKKLITDKLERVVSIAEVELNEVLELIAKIEIGIDTDTG